MPEGIQQHMPLFYDHLSNLGFEPQTIGQNVVPMSSPFDEVVGLMSKCDCTIVLGTPQIIMDSGRIKDSVQSGAVRFSTEWNQIEGAISIMLRKPTLMLLHKGVMGRGIFERGAANVFVHEFYALNPAGIASIVPCLEALRDKVVVSDNG